MRPIFIVGGGLAGCEAAWQIAKRGGRVVLFEMKPLRYSPAHRSPDLAELVCSNSFKSESLENAHGLLKAELSRLDSLILRAAHESRVPAGDSLAVDRQAFARRVTEGLESHGAIEIVRKEVTTLPQGEVTILATGPLTSDALSRRIQEITGDRHLFFYDAISPIVTGESIDFSKTFRASRYGKGGQDFINCPMDRETYYRFVEALVEAERVDVRDFEKGHLFEGCLPIEELADRGKDTLAFGPLKPVGLVDPRTGREPFAVVQLRQEDKEGRLYNLVGFQTRLKQGEQRRVFALIPGLENAEFVRWGSIHRNTFIHSPRLLTERLELRNVPGLFLAGQITGVEGYMESTAMGLLAGLHAFWKVRERPLANPPPTTTLGALIHYVTHSESIPFQPMNVNFGLLPSLKERLKGREKRRALSKRALEDLERWVREWEI